MHLARAGWVRWKDRLPEAPPRPGKGPLALRVRLAEPHGTGFDVTEAGTQKHLAVYVVRDPLEVPGVARLGPDPLSEDFTAEAFAALLQGSAGRSRGCSATRACSPGSGTPTRTRFCTRPGCRRSSWPPRSPRRMRPGCYAVIGATLTDAVERSRGLALGDLKAEKKSGLRVHGRTGEPCPVCGDTIREVSFSDSSLQYCPTCQTGGKPLADRRMSRLLK